MLNEYIYIYILYSVGPEPESGGRYASVHLHWQYKHAFTGTVCLFTSIKTCQGSRKVLFLSSI